jgi:hypothetical protein
MLSLPLLLQHSLLYGLLLTVIMSIVIFTTLYLTPEIWLGDAPADIQAALGPISPRARQQKLLIGVPMLLIVGALLLHAALRIVDLNGDHNLFAALALSTFLIVQVFNLFDLVVIDWLIVVTLRPSFVILPGTEGLPGYSDYGFHFRAFMKGLAGSAIVSILLAAGVVAVRALLV